MKEDYQTRKRYIPGFKKEQEWAKLQENVSRNDAFESRSALMHRRHNGAHCSYFHRWFQHPVWRLGQVRLGNGPYTLAGAFGEPVHSNFAFVDSSVLPDRPSRQAYARYQELYNDGEKKIEIPPNTPRALGGPAY
eukprot:4005783-Amphidinium_carterae.1